VVATGIEGHAAIEREIKQEMATISNRTFFILEVIIWGYLVYKSGKVN
jgi:hypothetical protein